MFGSFSFRRSLCVVLSLVFRLAQRVRRPLLVVRLKSDRSGVLYYFSTAMGVAGFRVDGVASDLLCRPWFSRRASSVVSCCDHGCCQMEYVFAPHVLFGPESSLPLLHLLRRGYGVLSDVQISRAESCRSSLEDHRPHA